MRAAFSSVAGAATLLHRTLPGRGPKMVALEGAATISGDEVRQSEAN
ncbi:MAG TPA: hypothetical protein VGM43_08950 [Bryobacteraceae bacterium]